MTLPWGIPLLNDNQSRPFLFSAWTNSHGVNSKAKSMSSIQKKKAEKKRRASEISMESFTSTDVTKHNDSWTSSQSHHYGILLHGYLKTRYVNMNNNSQSIFAFKSLWKLRYWRLELTDEGLILKKSRRVDARPYKSIFLPFGKTLVWENWGKRGDSKYCFGFTLRVAYVHMQMEVATDSENLRYRWLNILQRAFSTHVQDTKAVIQHLAQRASNHLSRMNEAANEHYSDFKSTTQQILVVNPNYLSKRFATDTSIGALTYTHTNTSNQSDANTNGMNDYDGKSSDELFRENTISRKCNADLYIHEGHINDYLDKNSLPCMDNVPDIIDETESEDDENNYKDIANNNPNHSQLTETRSISQNTAFNIQSRRKLVVYPHMPSACSYSSCRLNDNETIHNKTKNTCGITHRSLVTEAILAGRKPTHFITDNYNYHNHNHGSLSQCHSITIWDILCEKDSNLHTDSCPENEELISPISSSSFQLEQNNSETINKDIKPVTQLKVFTKIPR